jgi:hypothetical protein
MGRACSTHGGKDEFMQGFGGKVRKRQLRRPRHRWEDNIKMDVREIG